MTEEESVISALAKGGIIPVLLWAAGSAHARAWADFDPETGHDQAVLGYTAHKLLVDRQDRVFRQGRYVLTDGEDSGIGDTGQDVLRAGLAATEQDGLPHCEGVERADVSGSPAWKFGRYRWFPTAFDFGKVNELSWTRKSPTKQRIAGQLKSANPDQILLPYTYDQPVGQSLNEMTVGELMAANIAAMVDLILAHSVDPHSGATELHLGRARLNTGGGSPWHWLRPLHRPDSGDGIRTTVPQQTPPTRGVEVPDAPVRLRPRIAGGETAGEPTGS
ncbi:hypothetical protein [Micromonospora matsumotoense]|uniref:hypothetical protein n=1 Tax=Micromonospora matsumotoense TaxID=121616 RepID=UPI000B813426|nr:hypothetical protein [Micromonospora matsumotoense]